MSELQEQISRYRPGDKVMISLLRKDKQMDMPVILKSLDNTTRLVKRSELIKKSVDALGAEFTELDASELAKLRIGNGVKISKLGFGKLAQVGIQPGFIVTSIDRKKITTAEDIKSALENKTGMILIEGFYTNGMRASYSFSM